MAESPLTIFPRFRNALIGPELRSFGREQPLPNRGLVITLCVLASAILWFMFSMQETYTQFFDFPTSLQNVPPAEALTSLPPATVRVQVEGQGVQLLRLYYQPPTIPLDAASSPIDLTTAVAELAGSVRMESVVPTNIELGLETRVARRIPVQSRVRLTTENGYQVMGQVKLNPDSVTVSGALSLISSLEYWPTISWQIDEARSLTQISVPLADTLKGLIEIDAEEVELMADVQAFTEGVRQIEIRVLHSPGGRAITFVPASTSATFQVPLKEYDQAMAAPDFYAIVEYREIRTDTTGMVYPAIHIPDGLAIRESRISPDAFGYYFNLPEQQ